MTPADKAPQSSRKPRQSLPEVAVDLKQMEGVLAESQQYLATIFATVQVGILVIDAETHAIVDANPKAVEIIGTPREAMIGSVCHRFICPSEEGCCPITDLGQTIDNSERALLTATGARVPIIKTVASVTLRGRPHLVETFLDISERKRAEQEREEWNLTLEKKVEEKTRHLKEAQAKLIQSEKMATLSEVVAGAAHELNNPLAGILGAIQLLRSSSLVKPIEPALMADIDVLESMESAAGRCQRIVDDLIRFSTQARCSFTRVDINEVLGDTLEAMGEQFARAGTTVTFQADPALPSIEGDFVKLFEVFANILQNAHNALPDGGSVEVATGLTKGYGEPPQVVVTIHDTGCGIPAHNLGKIFDPFFTTKPAGKGPGLGLTVSYGVVKRHHGDIEVRSVTGKGTEVTITLPLKQPAS